MADISNFTDSSKPSAPNAKVSTDFRWWEKSGDEVADSVSGVLKALEDSQQKRVGQHITSARLYGNLTVLGVAGMTLSRAAASQPALKDRISYNLAQSCVDTSQAKMSKNRPRPYFLTNGGDYRQQRKAKRLNQFTDGMFYEARAYPEGIERFRDGQIFGDGITHVFARDGRVRHERVLSSELFVDEEEARYGNPRSMHRVKDVDRGVLKAWLKKNKIQTVTASTLDDGQTKHIADAVTVRESWHLPSGPDAKDGKHVITVDGTLLLTEDWPHDFFPFARFQWCPRLWGYWGQGLVEQIQNIQLEINKLLFVVQRSFHLGGSFKVFLENGSKIVKEHLNNDIGAIVNYTGQEPKYVTPPLVSPEIYQHLEVLIRRGYEQAGISQLNASSQKPAGLNSGKALREYDDIGTDRFLTIGQRYQQYFLDLARLSISTAKDIAEENGGRYSVEVPGKKFLRKVDWKDIDLDEDQYVMQCFPVSSLPSDPEGRLQTIQEYIEAGFISPRQGKRLLDFPDLEQLESLQNAAEDYLSEVLDKMCDHGEYTAPDRYDDLVLGREMALEYYQRGKCQGLEDDRLDHLRTFISQIDGLQAEAASMAAPPMPGATSGTSAPLAQPMPTPQSDLVPNVPTGASVQ